MKDKVVKNRRFIYMIVSIIGIIGFVVGLSVSLYYFIVDQSSLSVEGIIKEIEIIDNKTVATVSYSVNEKDYEAKIPLRPTDDQTVNNPISITVDVKNPNKVINNNVYIPLSVFVISVLFIIIAVPISRNDLKESKNLKFLKEKGVYVFAQIEGVFINNNGQKYHKQLPYRVRCKYQNPADNNLYIFDSNDTYVNLSEVIAKYNAQTIRVYLDPTNTKNYYVDLESLSPQLNIVDPVEFMKNKPVEQETEETPTEGENAEENGETKNSEEEKDNNKEKEENKN